MFLLIEVCTNKMTLWAILKSMKCPEWNLEFHTIKRGCFTIGRLENCSVTLSDLRISDRHLLIYQKINAVGCLEVNIEDNSTNGTFINGQRMEPHIPNILHNNSQISFPCEDYLRQDYIFIFIVVENKAINIQSPLKLTTAPKVLDNEQSNLGSDKNNDNFIKWEELEEVKNNLIKETCRLTASVYSNNKIIDLLMNASDSEFTVDEEENIKNQTNDVYLNREIDKSYQKYIDIIENMMCNIQEVVEIVKKNETINSETQKKIISSLKVEYFQKLINELDIKLFD